MDKKNEKILIVDDARLNLTILSSMLNPKYNIFTARDGQTAINIAKEARPDLVLLDIILPDLNGFEIIKIFKNSDILRDIPIIFITGLSNVEDEIKGLSLGAIDYIKKPFVPEIVTVRVDNQIRLARQRKLIEDVAQYDALTQIPNRRNFDRKLQKEWEFAQKYSKKLNIGYIDIDYFKQYNDNYGHAKGDEVLRMVASCVFKIMDRNNGYIARIGGEEFCFMLQDKEMSEAIKEADSIRLAIEYLGIEHSFSKNSNVLTVSIGGLSANILEETDKVAVLKTVDDNLYKAKNSGRNRVVWETEE